MRSFVRSAWPACAGALLPVLLVCVPTAPRSDARGDDKPARPKAHAPRPVSYLREVRPILAQHCFQCHGPDEKARKAKLRLDLKEHTLAERKGQHVIAPGDPNGSLVWERLTTD